MYTLNCIHSTSSNLIQALKKESIIKLLLPKGFLTILALMDRFNQNFFNILNVVSCKYVLLILS